VRAAPTRTIVLAAVQDRGLHSSLAQLARGLNSIAANLNDLFNGASADVKNFLDSIAADLKHISNGTSTDLEDILDCRTATFHRVWHYFAPVPETGSIIIFIESALGCDAISIAATASSSGKRWLMSWVRSNPLL
jgi:ABC-type Zn uptake system ZnuABC Zn-binding protein ZnuA